MTNFEELLTMKLIEKRRMGHWGSDNPEIMNHLFPKITRNLCAKINAVDLARFQALANFLDTNKTALLLEMIDSCMAEAWKQFEAAGQIEAFRAEMEAEFQKVGIRIEPTEDGGERYVFDDLKAEGAE